MGDVADMMLDGTLCSGCGMYIDEDGDGIPRECNQCAAETARGEKVSRKADNLAHAARQKKTKCPHCGKRVKEIGLAMHIDALHSDIAPEVTE